MKEALKSDKGKWKKENNKETKWGDSIQLQLSTYDFYIEAAKNNEILG